MIFQFSMIFNKIEYCHLVPCWKLSKTHVYIFWFHQVLSKLGMLLQSLLLLKKNMAFAPFCFLNFLKNLLFYSIYAFTWQAARAAQLVKFWDVRARSRVLLPCGPKSFFLNTCFLIFFTNFTNLFHISKLIIFRWFFAHLSLNRSILWLWQKILKMFTFWLFLIYLKISHFNDLKNHFFVILFNSNQLSHFTSIFCFILNIVWCS